MIEDQVREDIAFIRRAVEEGGAYATARSPDMLVWGVAVAIGHLGTFGFIRGWSPIAPGAVWAACIGLPWLYSLRRQLHSLIGTAPPGRGPMAQALAMLWLGCGVFLTTLAIAWWIGEIALFALRYDPAVRLPLAAVLMLVLLAGPGLVLLRRRHARAR